jgi:hypothetical protein
LPAGASKTHRENMRTSAHRNSSRHLARCAALVLAVIAWPSSGNAAGGLVPQHSEDLRPAFKRAADRDTATLEVSAFGRDFRLRLSNNPRLARLAAGSSVQLYTGTLEGTPGSWARIAIQDGLPRGMIWDGQEMFIVDAAAEGVNFGASGTVMFKLSDAVLEQGVTFVDDAVEKPRDAAATYDAMIGELRASTQALKDGVATEGVGISILADAAFLARYSSETQAHDALLMRMNNVDGIFSSQLGVELQVESVNVADEFTSNLSATTDSSALLQSLAQLRQGNPALSATGLTHLFTGRRLDGRNAGIAYTEALCSRRFAASLTLAHDSAALDSLITAHEIGHVFGAPHDGVQQCATTPQNQYIMTPSISTSVSSFSQCSLDQINEVIDSYSCVVALPPPAPATPAPPDPPPGGSDGGGGDKGGGGSLDPALLLLLLALQAVRLPWRPGSMRPR